MSKCQIKKDYVKKSQANIKVRTERASAKVCQVCQLCHRPKSGRWPTQDRETK